MKLQPGKQTIAQHILNDILRNKSNQTMKYGKLPECDMSNIFFEESRIKCGGETILRPFCKNSKLKLSLYQWSRILYSLFFCMSKSKAIKIY